MSRLIFVYLKSKSGSQELVLFVPYNCEGQLSKLLDTASKGKHHIIKISLCDLDKISHTIESALPPAGDHKAARNRQESMTNTKQIWYDCEFVTFPLVFLGHVWYLIVLIPDLCTLTYFDLPGIALRLVPLL